MIREKKLSLKRKFWEGVLVGESHKCSVLRATTAQVAKRWQATAEEKKSVCKELQRLLI